MSTRKWNNLPGFIVREYAYLEKGEWFDEKNDLPQGLIPKITGIGEKHWAELEIHFLSSGYYDSGSMYGGTDHTGWAPEGEDIRTLDKVVLTVTNCDDVEHKIKLSREQQQKIFDHFQEAVDDADVEYQEA